MSNLCIGTGWCALKEGHNNKERSKLQNSPDWLEDYWRPHIEAQIEPAAWVIYESRGDWPAKLDLFGGKRGEEHILSKLNARELPYRHDWVASTLEGAAYALFNNMDYLYIEQDCMVHNLPAVLEFAKDHLMCYGWGKYSLYPGWAENSLIWVRHDGLARYIFRLLSGDMRNCDGKDRILEVQFHRYFENMTTPWPFGFGRIRPIDFSQLVFYAQQLTDNEIHRFQGALKGKF